MRGLLDSVYNAGILERPPPPLVDLRSKETIKAEEQVIALAIEKQAYHRKLQAKFLRKQAKKQDAKAREQLEQKLEEDRRLLKRVQKKGRMQLARDRESELLYPSSQPSWTDPLQLAAEGELVDPAILYPAKNYQLGSYFLMGDTRDKENYAAKQGFRNNPEAFVTYMLAYTPEQEHDVLKQYGLINDIYRLLPMNT